VISLSWFNQSGFDEIEVDSGGLQFVLDTAGSVACETDFTSGVRIVDPNGKDVSFDTKEGIPVWSQIPEGSVLEWRVETKADAKKGASDRVNIDITSMDPSYMARIANKVIDSLDEDQLIALLQGDNTPMENYLEQNPDLINPELAQATFYSQTVVTDDDGKATGTIPIDPAWGKNLFSINFHYGYSDLAEMSTDDKTERVWMEEIGPVLVEVLATVALAAISGGAALAFRAGWVARVGVGATRIAKAKTQITKVAKIAFAVEMAQMTKAYFAKGFGIVGLNKYDCSFPLAGFNHVYSFDTDYIVALKNEAGEIDLSELDENQLEALFQQELVRNLAVGAIATGLLIWVLTR
jgi:hypothetical protein